MADTNAVLTWFRIQPSPAGEDIAASLRCETRDGLWLLGRQWQLGEFSAEDAGAAAFSHVTGHSVPLQLIAFPGQEPVSYQSTEMPVNVVAERLTPAFSLTFRLEAGRHWQRMLHQAGQAAIWDIFRQNPLFQFKRPIQEFNQDNPELAAYSYEPYQQMLAALGGGRMLDGQELFEELKTRDASDFIPRPDVADEDIMEVNKLAKKWLDWVHHKLGTHASYWDPSHLEYRAAAAAQIPDATASLQMPEHPGRPMHWYAWEQNSAQTDWKNKLNRTDQVRYQRAYIPRAVSFPGMPRARWWEMEEGTIDMGNISASRTDTGLLLLTEFSLLYSNDWLLFPLSVPLGHLANVSMLRVTDTFGVQSSIAPSTNSVPAPEWDLYHLNTEDNSALKHWLFLPPVSNNWLQSQPMEEVHFIRDEMANMVWAMEKTVFDAMGEGIDGKNAARQFENLLHKLVKTPAAVTPDILPNNAQLKYILGNNVPPNWIPFLPVRLESEGSHQMVLRRAAIPRLIEGQMPTRIRPRTQILGELVSTGRRFDIEEEEIPVTGLTVRQVWRRTRWTDGRVITWLAREKYQGRHLTGSGLRFDQIEEK